MGYVSSQYILGRHVTELHLTDMHLQLACGTIFGIIMGAPPHWFKRKLGRALGTMALGSSVAGTVYPILIKNLIQKVG